MSRKLAKAKRKTSSRTRRRKRLSMADLERQLSHRTDELAKAREQQTATALVNFRLQNELRAIGDRQKKPAPKSCAPSPTLRDVPNTH